jgi:hypothetical protein
MNNCDCVVKSQERTFKKFTLRQSHTDKARKRRRKEQFSKITLDSKQLPMFLLDRTSPTPSSSQDPCHLAIDPLDGRRAGAKPGRHTGAREHDHVNPVSSGRHFIYVIMQILQDHDGQPGRRRHLASRQRPGHHEHHQPGGTGPGRTGRFAGIRGARRDGAVGSRPPAERH